MTSVCVTVQNQINSNDGKPRMKGEVLNRTAEPEQVSFPDPVSGCHEQDMNGSLLTLVCVKTRIQSSGRRKVDLFLDEMKIQ